MTKPIRTAAFLCLVAPALAAAADLDGRVTRLENIVENQRSSDALLQIQRLQQEMQQLRGLVEQQQFEIDNLKRQQSEQYMDVDRRLGGQGSPPPPATAPAPLTGRSQAAAPPAPLPEAEAESAPSRLDLAPPPAKTAGSVNEKEAYRDAFDLLKQRRYDEAIGAFQDLLARYPNGELADNARYWLGETYYVKRDFGAALDEFRRVLNDYPISPKVPGAMLKIGYIQDERKEWSAARTTLQDLAARFPDSTEARLAKGRLERMARDGH
jgi:tol-pal system protein YbgF